MQDGDGMQKSKFGSTLTLLLFFIKEPLLFLVTLAKKIIFQGIEKFFTPIGLLFVLIIFQLWPFPTKDLNKEDAGRLFDIIGKITGKSSITNDIHINGAVDATVSMPFKDATQACWYYHADYANSHPYTVLWKKSEAKGGYPIIRVIAEPAYWRAEKCTRKNGKVKLRGIEYTKHSIEAQFSDETGFVQIATSEAYYRSALFFDKNGRITERKVLESDFGYEYDHDESVYKSVFSHICHIHKKPEECHVPNDEMKKENRHDEIPRRKFKDLTSKKDNFNYLIITSGLNLGRNLGEPESEESKIYHRAVNLYIEKRKDLHEGLVKDGCGAISIEPELTEDPQNLFRTSIAFLCLKKSGEQSHVRLMHRVSGDFEFEGLE